MHWEHHAHGISVKNPYLLVEIRLDWTPNTDDMLFHWYLTLQRLSNCLHFISKANWPALASFCYPFILSVSLFKYNKLLSAIFPCMHWFTVSKLSPKYFVVNSINETQLLFMGHITQKISENSSESWQINQSPFETEDLRTGCTNSFKDFWNLSKV